MYKGSQLDISGSVDGSKVPYATLMRGRLPSADDETALAPAPFRTSKVQLGDSISVTTVDGHKRSLRVVGEALLDDGNVPTFDDGGFVTAKTVADTATYRGQNLATPWVAVKLRPGIDRDKWIARLGAASGVSVSPFVAPSPASNILRIRTTPLVLAALLAMLAAAAALLALLLQARGLRREHAGLRSVGLTRRQTWSVLPQHAAFIGCVTAIVFGPLGVVLGRQAWRSRSDAQSFLYVAPTPYGQTGAMLVVVIGVAVVLSLIPATTLARSSVARALRAE